MNNITTDFDLNCRSCPRLACFFDENKKEYSEYHLECGLILVSSYHAVVTTHQLKG